MRLKSIKLAGFKSFVDPTTVHFPSNMSAVVGPNGCGKSNIIDAVRWVMGESSAKNLRGESMTDVIFNGSNSRKPVGQASIELVFDNSDATLTGEYAAYSEIAIKRIVNREAESTYLLNGTRCRRKDITDIFLGTGLGPRSYAIIEQGMISKLIEAKPEELRIFVEEAAGISKYKERRRDTENRIRRTRENLERLTDIREELDRQLQRLQRQARTAQRYREFKQEERQLEAQHMAIQWRDLSSRSADQGRSVRDLELQLEAQLSARVSADANLDTLRVRHADQSDAFNAVQGEFYALGAEIARGEQQLQYQREREQQLRHDLQQTEDDLRQTARHIEHDRTRLEQWRCELEDIAPQLEDQRAADESCSAELLEAEEAMQHWQQRWDDFNQAAAAPRRESEVQQSRIQHLDQALKRLGERLQRLQREHGEVLVADDEEEAVLQEQLAATAIALEDGEAEREQLLAEIESRRERQEHATRELNAARTESQQAQGRRASLEALQQAALGEDEASVRWLDTHGLAERARLADGLGAEDGWEKAVETVLGSYLQAVSVPSIDELAQQLAAAPGAQLAFYEGAAGAGGAVPGHGLLPLAARVTGAGDLLAGVYCCESLVEALAQRRQLAAGESVITRDGIWVGASWLRVAREADQQGGVIARHRELEQLSARLEVLAQTIDDLEAERADAAGHLKALEVRRQQAEQRVREQHRRQGQLASQLSALRVRLEQAELGRQRIERDTAETREQIVHEQQSVKEARQLLQQALDRMEQDAGARDALQTERDASRAVLEQVRRASRQARDLAHQLAMREQSLSAQVGAAAQGLERLQGQLDQLRERRETLAEALAENLEPLEEVKESLELNLEQRLRIERRLSEARNLLEAIDGEVRETEGRRNRAERQIDTLRGDLEQQRLAARTLEVQLKTLQDQLEQNRFELAAILDALPEDAAAGQWQEALEQLRGRIERLGPINLAAIDEYEAQAERKLYLDAQNADLATALEALENAIQKIDRETRSRFKETFGEINAGLQELFPKVFGGGHAYLELTGEDLLDTGIAIMARPPGKRNSTIHLLSGGEKALTAIALVFAIFRLNPAPFCMLDEVDAPLDDANVGRYARIVKEMSEQVQFIYITHNKIAMEYADQLMGVTMHEAGCSRLVTVDIEEAAELAAV